MMNRDSAHFENWKSKQENTFGLNLKMKSKLKFKGRVDPKNDVIMNFCADIKDVIVSKLEAFRKANPCVDQKGFQNISKFKQQAATVQKLKGGKIGILKHSDKSMGTAISTSNKNQKGAWQPLSDTRTYSQLQAEENAEFCTKSVKLLTEILRKHNGLYQQL